MHTRPLAILLAASTSCAESVAVAAVLAAASGDGGRAPLAFAQQMRPADVGAAGAENTGRGAAAAAYATARSLQNCPELLHALRDRSDAELLGACRARLAADGGGGAAAACGEASAALGEARPWPARRVEEACDVLNAAGPRPWGASRRARATPDGLALTGLALRSGAAAAVEGEGGASLLRAGAGDGEICPAGWVLLQSTCFSPPALTVNVTNATDQCELGDCGPLDEKCADTYGSLATKSQLHLWIASGGNRLRQYGVTSTKKTESSNQVADFFRRSEPWTKHYHWLTDDEGDYGWHEEGCCGRSDRYFVCTLEASVALDLAMKRKHATKYQRQLQEPLPPYGNWTSAEGAAWNGTDFTYFQYYTDEVHEDAPPPNQS